MGWADDMYEKGYTANHGGLMDDSDDWYEDDNDHNQNDLLETEEEVLDSKNNSSTRVEKKCEADESKGIVKNANIAPSPPSQGLSCDFDYFVFTDSGADLESNAHEILFVKEKAISYRVNLNKNSYFSYPLLITEDPDKNSVTVYNLDLGSVEFLENVELEKICSNDNAVVLGDSNEEREDYEYKLYSTLENKVIKKIKIPSPLSFHDPYFVMEDYTGEGFCIYDNSLELIKEFEDEGFVEIHEDLSLIVAESDFETIFYDSNDFSIKKTVPKPKTYSRCVYAIINKNIVIVSGSSMYLWDVINNKYIFRFESYENMEDIGYITICGNNYILCKSSDSKSANVLCWDLSNGKFINNVASGYICTKIRDGYRSHLKLAGAAYDRFAIVDYDTASNGPFYDLVDVVTAEKLHKFSGGEYISSKYKVIVSRTSRRPEGGDIHAEWISYLSVFDVESRDHKLIECNNYYIPNDESVVFLTSDQEINILHFNDLSITKINLGVKIESFTASSDLGFVFAITNEFQILKVSLNESRINEVDTVSILERGKYRIVKASPDCNFLIIKKIDRTNGIKSLEFIMDISSGNIIESNKKKIDFLEIGFSDYFSFDQIL